MYKGKLHDRQDLAGGLLRSSSGGGKRGWREATIVESINRRPYIFQSALYGRLIYAVLYMSDRLKKIGIPIRRTHLICVVTRTSTGLTLDLLPSSTRLYEYSL